MAAFKLQVQDDDGKPEVWRDVLAEAGSPLIIENEADARAKLAEMFPVLVKMEQFAADRKRTRVIVVNPYDDIDHPPDD